MPSATLSRNLLLTTCGLLFTMSMATSVLHGQVSTANSLDRPPAAGPHRPASVPEDYVVTPFGYFHPSCVQRISDEELLLADGHLQRADGTVTIQTCKFPRYAHDGSRVIATAGRKTPEVNGWIENTNVVASASQSSYGRLLSAWTVPPAPKNDDGQILYFFPGLEDINHTQSILQPVLQWAGGQWGVANWNCCLNNITTESTLINVRPKDEIVASISNACKAGTSCATWTILSLNLRNGESTTLKQTPSDGQVFDWAFGGVMEPYYVIDCNDYPPNKNLRFDIFLFDDNLSPVLSPQWAPSVNHTQTPQCGYGIKALPYQTEVDY